MTKVRHVLGISGGKDSAALAIYMKQKYPTLEIEYYNSDTGCELEETEKLVDNLESFLGKVVRLKAAKGSPEPTPFDHFLKISGGYLPSPQARWCTQKMKLAEFEKFVGDEPAVSYVGIRGDEEREGYVSTKANIQAIFPFRKNIWSLDVIHKVLHNDSLALITDLYKKWASNNIKKEAIEIASTPINKSFFYSRKLNALLDLSVKTFNRVVFEFLKTTDYPVGKLEEFPLIDNEDILVKEDIFRILEESGVGVPAYYNPIEFEVDGKKESIAVAVQVAISASFSSALNGFGYLNNIQNYIRSQWSTKRMVTLGFRAKLLQNSVAQNECAKLNWITLKNKKF